MTDASPLMLSTGEFLAVSGRDKHIVQRQSREDFHVTFKSSGYVELRGPGRFFLGMTNAKSLEKSGHLRKLIEVFFRIGELVGHNSNEPHLSFTFEYSDTNHGFLVRDILDSAYARESQFLALVLLLRTKILNSAEELLEFAQRSYTKTPDVYELVNALPQRLAMSLKELRNRVALQRFLGTDDPVTLKEFIAEQSELSMGDLSPLWRENSLWFTDKLLSSSPETTRMLIRAVEGHRNKNHYGGSPGVSPFIQDWLTELIETHGDVDPLFIPQEFKATYRENERLDEYFGAADTWLPDTAQVFGLAYALDKYGIERALELQELAVTEWGSRSRAAHYYSPRYETFMGQDDELKKAIRAKGLKMAPEEFLVKLLAMDSSVELSWNYLLM